MKYIYSFILCLLPILCHAQNDSVRMAHIDYELQQLTTRDSTFRNSIDISSGRLTLSELLRNIARASGANLSVRNVENIPVSCNFNRIQVDDLIRFLCREYRLDIDITGNIVSIFPAVVSLPEPNPRIEYNASDSTLSYDLIGEQLIDVAKKITNLTRRNVVIPQPLYGHKISGYLRNMPLNDAMVMLASVNGLAIEYNTAGVWNFYRDNTSDSRTGHGPTYIRHKQFSENELRVDSLGRITAHITRSAVQDLILDLCEQLGLNYYFHTPVNITTGIYVNNTDFETLLNVLLKGSPYSYYREQGIYIFGSAEQDRLTAVSIVPLAFRSVSKIDEIIPQALAKEVGVKVFPDLNSLILSGDGRDVGRVESFIKSVDKPVPLITIEIIIADVQKSDIKEAGIEMGLAKGVKTAGTISPGIGMTFNAASINQMIRRFNGFGSVNLGKVTPDFYMSLQFLEENGTLNLQSTPKLSTLNGHEATLTSGEKQYYKEVQNSYIGTQNPIQSESYTWKSVDANLSIKVTPYVSTDNHITMQIEIEQTEFTDRVEKDAPPGTATRSFKSIIKVENEEVVLLGGIDRNSREKSTRGLPFIAKVPVLKWLFGKHKNNKVERKLSVFIKPTIIE